MRFYAQTLGLFAVAAIVLAAVGIYGPMSYSVADRLHEIGIRLSVGASPSGVLWLIVAQGLRIAAVGIVIGIAGSLMMTRLLEGFLFGLKPWDPLTFSCVATLVLMVTLIATALPASRATRVDPVLALRHE
jgi:putative ABC transport system permease protein